MPWQLDRGNDQREQWRVVTRRRQEAAAILAGRTAGRMGVAEANEPPCPAEPELTLRWSGCGNSAGTLLLVGELNTN